MKGKACLQIIIIIFAAFAISINNSTPVTATPQQVCCEKTVSGNSCQYTTTDQCDPQYKTAATNCQQTSFCKLGCGYQDDEGMCFKNTARATCQQTNGCTYLDTPTCETAQCQLGCCILSGEASYVTEARCKLEASRNENANMTFDPSIESEQVCINQARSGEQGACVADDGTCRYTTRGDCNQEQRFEDNATKINPNIGFHKDLLCSNPVLGTICAKQQYTGCLPDKDEVYWFDSCGNPENIYSSNKEQSYNQGYTQPKSQSCTLNGANDPSCGNCDYTQNNLCGQAGRDNKPTYGNYVCQDLNCQDIKVEATSPASSTAKRNGESWCSFDSKVGFGQDLVGSRYYRKLCINGEVLTEPCKDYREEMCIQGVQGQSPLSLTQSTKLTAANTNYVEALCRDNRWQDCSKQQNKNSCGNIAFRDCQWVGAGIDVQNGGSCIPFVPPGLPFWPDKGEEKAVPNANAKEQCNKGNQECTITYEKGGLSSDWECIANCDCKKQEWLDAANQLCISQGDCGAYYNYKGSFTSGGAQEEHPGKITEKSVQNYNSLVNPKSGAGTYGFGAFFTKSALPLTLFAAQGLIASYGLFGVVGATGGTFAGISSGFGLLSAAGQSTVAQAGAEVIGNAAFNAAAQQTIATAAAKQAAAATAKQIATQAAADALKAGATEAAKTAAIETAKTATAAELEASLASEAAATATADAGSSLLGSIIPIVNIILIIWTIYNLLDVLLADTKEETVSFTCNPWVAPTGGRTCETCGNDGKPCSEYRCRSLGQTCKLINEGSSKELCVDTNPNDANSPIINVLKEALEKNFTIQDTPNQGYTITNKIKPFTPVTLAIKTNEPSQCKYALNTSTTYENMPAYFGDSIYDYNHTMQFSLPSELAEPQVLKITNGGNYQLFVKCQDNSGNINKKDYYIKFSIQPGPDLTPPSIELTSIKNGAPIAAGTNTTALTIYTNEPSQCTWSLQDKEYAQMENNFVCATSNTRQRSIYYGLYECITTITNIKANQLNNYYFRCKDQPGKADNKRNVNIESYKFSLQGTTALRITQAGPTGELFTKNPTLSVTTTGGAEAGKAACAFSTTDINNAIDFIQTNSNIHQQPFTDLPTGNYNYKIFCIDQASNQANTTINFRVSVDTVGPRLIRVYKAGTIMHIDTNEDSTCEYSTRGDFTYGTGTLMTGDNVKEHEASLDSNIYFIRCKDTFNNEAHYKVYP